MGMGKTIQTLALLHQHRLYPSSKRAGTLIVAPLALLNQWEKEILEKSANRLTVYIHHGPKRFTLKEQLRKFDVVITTYSVLAMESPKEEKVSSAGQLIPGQGGGALYKANFQRIVLDEAQLIKNHRTTCSIACSNMLAQSR